MPDNLSLHHIRSNQLLAALPSDVLAAMIPHFTAQTLKQGMALYEAGDEVEHVYFPQSGMISLLAVMQNGKAIETATIGREGVAGAMAGLGLYRSMVRAVIQLPMVTTRISAARFRQIASQSKPVENLCIRYNEVLLTQARLTAACNALHPIDSRFCRWLLQSADRAEAPTLPLTQELLAEMLGVRRTSVTEVAGRLQKDGLISFSRGVIQILDRPALEAITCECYQSLIDQAATLGSPTLVASHSAA